MSQAATAPLTDNEHVVELLSILKKNGKDASGLTALIGYIGSMESQLNKAAEELQGVRNELNNMREERSHPLRTAMLNAAQSMEDSIAEARSQLEVIKSKLIEGCKNAVAEFKQKGISALNGIAKFFGIKPSLESLRKNLQNDIKRDQAAIARIKAISTQYHKTGRAIRNLGRAVRGKKPIPGVKPNGKLASLIAAPFRAEINCLTNAQKDLKKAIAALNRLEKAAPKKAADKDRGDDKLSVKDTMKRYQAQIDQSKKETPVATKSKNKEAEI